VQADKYVHTTYLLERKYLDTLTKSATVRALASYLLRHYHALEAVTLLDRYSEEEHF